MTASELAAIWSKLAAIPIGVAVVVAAIHLKRLNRSQRWIGLLCLVSLFVQIASSVLWNLERNNLPLLHFYAPLELVILLRFFHSVSTNVKQKKLSNYLSILFVIASILNVLFVQSIYEFNYLLAAIASLILVFFSINTWVQIMKDLKIEKLTRNSTFWFNSAILIYFSINFILFLSNNELNKLAVSVVRLPWMVHAIFMTIYYFLLSIGLWKQQKA